MDSSTLPAVLGFALMIIIFLFIKYVSNKTNTKFTFSQKWNPSNSFSIEPNGYNENEINRLNKNLQAFDLGMSMEHEMVYVANGDKIILSEYQNLNGHDRTSIESYLQSHPSINPEPNNFQSYDSQCGLWCLASMDLYNKVHNKDISTFKTLNTQEKQNLKMFIKHHEDRYAKLLEF